MVLRMMANAAVHGLAGTALGITTALAAYTVARTAKQAMVSRVRGSGAPEEAASNDR